MRQSPPEQPWIAVIWLIFTASNSFRNSEFALDPDRKSPAYCGYPVPKEGR
jgi:hypothetical protein